jgi:uncharacterized protein (DUF58 family)
VRPSSNPSHIKQLVHVMTETVPQRKTSTGPILHDLAERLKKRGVTVVISDLFDDVPGIISGLKHFRHRRHEVIVLHVLDPAEVDFPFRETTLFTGLEQLPQVLTDPRTLRKAYLKEFNQFLRDVQSGCRENQIDYVQLRTDQPLDVVLSAYLASRMTRA